jgi:hypothetical protein
MTLEVILFEGMGMKTTFISIPMPSKSIISFIAKKTMVCTLAPLLNFLQILEI